MSNKSGISILYWIFMGIILTGCATHPKVNPLQRAAAQVVRENPQNPEYWLEYGRACQFSNNPYGAARAFLHAIDLDTNYLPAYKHLGLVLVELQRYIGAKTVYERSLMIFDQDSELWTAYAYCLYDLGDNQNAIQAFQESIKKNTDIMAIISAHLGLSAIYDKQGIKDAAEREYQEAVKINPEIVKIVSENEKRK